MTLLVPSRFCLWIYLLIVVMPQIWERLARLNNSVLNKLTNDVVGCHSSHHASWQLYMLAWHGSITPQCQWKASGSFQSMSDVGIFADCWEHGIISIVRLHPPLLSMRVLIAVGLLTGRRLLPSTGLAICLWLLIDRTSQGETIVPTAEDTNCERDRCGYRENRLLLGVGGRKLLTAMIKTNPKISSCLYSEVECSGKGWDVITE